jgi:hypothetical protein
MLPSSITNMFSNDEKQRFTTTQENISEVIDQISKDCCNGDREKGKRVYQDAVNVIREKTRRRRQQENQGQEQEEGDRFLDSVLDSLKGKSGGGGGLF